MVRVPVPEKDGFLENPDAFEMDPLTGESMLSNLSIFGLEDSL